MKTVRRPWWQQATALVSVTAGGAVAGFNFAPGTPADLSAPAALPVHLAALEKSAQAASTTDDAALRSAIVNVAQHYLRLAQSRTPAEMEALIWGQDSTDGADHGPSCAAFASLTLELAAQAVGQQSWVSGGSTYPWPLHDWADVRVDPNSSSPEIVSILQDAQSRDRWHPLGDGYTPLPGDWVLFDGHVEVVTSYADGVLHTIGGDSLPNYSVNAHAYSGSLASYGITGFVDNGNLTSAVAASSPKAATAKPASSTGETSPTAVGDPVSGADATKPTSAATTTTTAAAGKSGQATIPGASASDEPSPKTSSTKTAGGESSSSSTYARSKSQSTSAPTTSTQAAFINEVAPGAMATQREYGVPAAVTIAQAIDESGWGKSELAVEAHNLFGIKGTGPAGSVTMPTTEYEDGAWVTIDAAFRAYNDYAESIADHAQLLATDSAYSHAMADRNLPDAFAADLAGVYATDPSYGGELVSLMRLYDLYRFDATAQSPSTTTHAASSSPASTSASKSAAGSGAAAVPATGAGTPAASTATSTAAGSANTESGGTGSAGTSSAGSVIPGAASPAATPAATKSSAARTTLPRRTPGRRPATRRPRAGSTNAAIPGAATITTAKYQSHIPLAVATAYVTTAKVPLARTEPLYRDVGEMAGIPWELLAACDWLQCAARPGHSPVHGEKLGKTNPDGTVYRTKSEALAQCAVDLAGLAVAVYGIDLTAPGPLSVLDLAKAFAAFRWGGLLRRNRVSAMEFPYSVAGLTAQHMKMCWPRITEQDVPDKPGARYRDAFGAVPLVLSLKYPATV
jgi:flagellum-specific peptidoglycan hydrolase FlgJ